jgi:GAF domain-containing protein
VLGDQCSVGLALEVQGGMRHAGVVETVAWTDARVLLLDQAQYTAKDGPCLDAYRTNSIVRSDEVASDARWPTFVAAAIGEGVVSVLSLPLAERDRAYGSFNIYATERSALDLAEGEVAAFTEQASIVLSNARAYDAAVRLAANLERAMQSRATIEQAKGKLMATSNLTAEEAFELMRRASQRENVKLRDVATRIMEGQAQPPS